MAKKQTETAKNKPSHKGLIYTLLSLIIVITACIIAYNTLAPLRGLKSDGVYPKSGAGTNQSK